MDDRQRMRASDRDRQEVVDRLRDAVAEGRLKMDEYVERMGRAYQAVTYGDLAGGASSPGSRRRSRCFGRSGWPQCRSTWWSGPWSAAPLAT